MEKSELTMADWVEIDTILMSTQKAALEDSKNPYLTSIMTEKAARIEEIRKKIAAILG